MRTIQCEKCRAAFTVDPAKIPPAGTKARCGKCGHVFPLLAETAPAEASADFQDMILADDNAPETATEEPPVARPAQPFKVPSEALQKYQTLRNPSFKNADGAKPGAPSKGRAPSKRERERAALAWGCVALVAFLTTLCWRAGSASPARWIRALRDGHAVAVDALSVAKVRPRVFHAASLERFVRVDFQVENGTGNAVAAATLQVRIFRPDGARIAAQDIACCERPLAPGDRVDLAALFPLPAGTDLGSYEVAVTRAN